MDDQFGVPGQLRHQLGVRHTAADKTAVGVPRQVPFLARAQVIQNGDLGIRRHERGDNIAADKTGPAGYQDAT